MNSSLVNYTKLSPNCTKPRGRKITKITVHHVAGVTTVEALGNLFANASRKASSNYGIGSDGRVGLYVDEANQAWTSSNSENDSQAVTIEVSNSATGGNWPVSDKVLAKLIDLCVDICERNGIEKLNYTGDKTGNLTRHNMFAATACPGPYLQSKFPYIAEQVNKRLAAKKDDGKRYCVTIENLNREDADNLTEFLKGGGYIYSVQEMTADDKEEEVIPKPEAPWVPEVDEIVYFDGGKQYSNSNASSGQIRAAGEAKITKIVPGTKHPYHLVRTGKSGPYGWVDAGSFTKR